MSSVRLTSDFPEIARRLERNAEALVRRTAENIAGEAKQRAPRATGKLARSIKVHRVGEFEYRVEVGAWYAHFIEFGTVKMAARPFLTPAAEAERGDFQRAGRRLIS